MALVAKPAEIAGAVVPEAQLGHAFDVVQFLADDRATRPSELAAALITVPAVVLHPLRDMPGAVRRVLIVPAHETAAVPVVL
jgi:hypothetical protein